VKKKPEKRKHPRFQAQYGAYAALLPDAMVLGPIINISSGGLAFQYFNNDKSRKKTAAELAIFISGSEYYLGSVPFKTISDYVLVNENPFSSISMRVCGIQFGDLTDEQKERIDYFIKEHAQKK